MHGVSISLMIIYIWWHWPKQYIAYLCGTGPINCLSFHVALSLTTYCWFMGHWPKQHNGLSFYVALAPTMIDFCTVMNGCSFCSFSVYVLFLFFQVILSSKSWKGFQQFSSVNVYQVLFRCHVEVQGGCNSVLKPTFVLLESSWSGVKVDISTCSCLFFLVLFLYTYLKLSSLVPLIPQ